MRKGILCGLLVTVILLTTSLGATFAAEIPVFNGGFEDLPDGVSPEDAMGKLPYGWRINMKAGVPETDWSVLLSDENPLNGKYSLKITRTTTTLPDGSDYSIMIHSKPIPVEPGRSYAALMNVFVTKELGGTLHLYLEFWSDEGWWNGKDFWSEEVWANQTTGSYSATKRVAVPFARSGKYNTWEEVFVEGVAPENAKYVTIGLYSPSRSKVKCYVDDVRFAVK